MLPRKTLLVCRVDGYLKLDKHDVGQYWCAARQHHHTLLSRENTKIPAARCAWVFIPKYCTRNVAVVTM